MHHTWCNHNYVAITSAAWTLLWRGNNFFFYQFQHSEAEVKVLFTKCCFEMWVCGLGGLGALQWNWSRNESNAQICRGILFSFWDEGKRTILCGGWAFGDGMERIWSVRTNTQSTHLFCCSLGSYREFVVTSVFKDSLADSSHSSHTNLLIWSKIALIIFLSSEFVLTSFLQILLYVSLFGEERQEKLGSKCTAAPYCCCPLLWLL